MIETCQNSKTHLSGLIDGEIKEPILSDVKKHLQHCSDCSTQLRTITLFANDLKSKLNATYQKNVLDNVDLWTNLKDKLPNGCELIVNDFSNYIDHQLSPTNQEAVENHLQNCLFCSKQFKQFNLICNLAGRTIRQNNHSNITVWPQVRASLQNNCQLIQEELSAFYDQTIADGRQRDITQHLIKCPTCSKFFSEQTASSHFLKEFYKSKNATAISILPGIRARLRVIAFRKAAPKLADPVTIKTKALTGVYIASFVLILLFPLWCFSSRIESKKPEEVLLSSTCEEPARNVEAYVYAY